MYRNGRGVEKNDQMAQTLSDRYNKLADARLTPDEKIPDCDAIRLELSLSLHRNLNSGEVEAIIELKNVSGQTCRVEGASLNFMSPTVHENFPVKICQNCTSDGRDAPGSHVSLQPGGFAHMSVQWKDAPQTDGPKCVDISSMGVFLSFRSPQSRGSLSIVFPPPAPQVCSTANYSSLIAGRDPYLSAANTAALVVLKISAPKDTYYPGEAIYLRVTVPISEPLPPRNRCPQLFVLLRDTSGFTNYRPVGGPNDYSCKVVEVEHGEATLRVKVQLWNDKNSSEGLLQFFQYSSMGTEKDAWQLIGKSGTFTYRSGDPEKIVRTWGPEVKGLVLDTTLDTTTYPVGGEVAAHLAMRNKDATEPIQLPTSQLDFVIQDEHGQRLFPRGEDSTPLFFSGPAYTQAIAPGHIVTAEQHLWLGDLPPGTYTVFSRWEAYVVNCSPHLVCVDPSGQPPKPYAVVTSNAIAIHVVAPHVSGESATPRH
jgi:hypothetical protein